MESLLPVTSAAAHPHAALDVRARRRVAEDLALELEGRRRSVTLGGGLLLIPGAAGAATVVSAWVGVPLTWLPLCALLGSAMGPALTTALLALSTVVGVPSIRRHHRVRCRALGLSDDEIEEGWTRAAGVLDDRARKKLGGRAKDERSRARSGQG